MTNPTTPTIPVDAIKVGDNVRRNIGDVRELARSIATVGLLNPITLRLVPELDEDGEGDLGVHFELVAGHRRLAAVKALGWDEVPYTIVSQYGADGPARERIAVQLVENLQREDLGPMEEARGLAELVELVGSQKAAAEAIGKSTAHVSKRLTLLKLTEPAVALVDTMPIEDVVELAKLPDTVQKAIARKVDGEVHPRTVRAHITDAANALTREAASRKAAKAAAGQRANRNISVVAAPDVKAGWKSLEGWGGLAVDFDRHRKEPCHVLAVGYFNRWDREVESHSYCSDPESHEPEGASKLKADPDPRAAERAKRDAEMEERRKRDAEERARWSALAVEKAEALDRNTALKVLSLHVLSGFDADLVDVLAAIGVTVEPPADELYRSSAGLGGWVREALEGLTVAQTYRAATVAVLGITAASPTAYYRNLPLARQLAELVGIEPDPQEEE